MQVLSRRVAASAFISKHAGARPWAQGSGPATSPSPSPSPSMQQLPPTDKQLAFAETLAEQHNVELPAEVCWPHLEHAESIRVSIRMLLERCILEEIMDGRPANKNMWTHQQCVCHLSTAEVDYRVLLLFSKRLINDSACMASK